MRIEENDVRIHRYGCKKIGESQWFQDTTSRCSALIAKGKGRTAFYQNIEKDSIFLVGDIFFTDKKSSLLTSATLKKIRQHPSSK